MNFTQELLGNLSTFLCNSILIILLAATGLYFSLRTGFIQFRALRKGLRLLKEKTHHHDGVPSSQAPIMSVTSRAGTGNVVGVATTLAVGGTSPIFWIWAIALIGGVSAFIESTLAQVYEERDGGQFHGGPIYYIEKALHKGWLGILFVVLLIVCSAFGSNGLQTHNINSALEYYVTDTQAASMLVGLIFAGATAAVIFKSAHRIGIINSMIVPIMAALYILPRLYITIANIGGLPVVFTRISQGTFGLQAVSGGFVGSCVMYDIKCGLFSNEADMRSAPGAGAAAGVSHSAKQRFVQTVSVFIDTALICSTTVFALLNFDIRDGLTGIPYVQIAASVEVRTWGIHLITISIILFAFSSLIGNYYCAESNLKFTINNEKTLLVFRLLTVAVIFFRVQTDFSTIWDLVDVLTGFMAIGNILVILLLGNVAFPALKNYMKQRKQGEGLLSEP